MSLLWVTATKESTYYHGTYHDLDSETHVRPPSETGQTANWEDMDPGEHSRVFMSHTPQAAAGFAADSMPHRTDNPRVYQVHPEGRIESHPHMTTADRARIMKRVQ